MKSTDYFNRTIEALRRLETYGYQLAYYILQDEDLAMDVTKKILLDLAQVEGFHHISFVAQRDMLKNKMIMQSIRMKHDNLTA